MKIRKRHPLSKKEVKTLLKQIGWLGYGDKVNRVEYVELEKGYSLYIIGKRDVFIRLPNGLTIPSLISKSILSLKRVYVDDGAVPHILNGADVMAPGITKMSPGIGEGDIVLIVGKRRPLAIGIVLEGWETAMSEARGKVVKNLHHQGDKMWQIIKKIIVE